MFNALAHSLLSFTGLGSSHSGGAAEEVEESEIDGCPSEDDVAAVRKDLLNFLPLELVDVILDTAEYWPRVSTLQEVPIVVVNNQACCYLITDPMPGPSHPDESGEFQQHRSIREVRFKIRSRDQGWGGEPEHQGTYNGSWSWFEAVILRPSPKLDNSSWYNTALSKPTILRPNEYKMLCSSERDDHPQHWYIQCNVTADENWREHVITWKTEGDSVVGTYDQFKGRVNRGYELVRSLEPGDRLAVIARAMFPGWANHVASVSVEIFYFFW